MLPDLYLAKAEKKSTVADANDDIHRSHDSNCARALPTRSPLKILIAIERAHGRITLDR